MTEDFSLHCPLPVFEHDTIELAHGSGGLLSQRLLDSIFRPAFETSAEDFMHDGALFNVAAGRLAMSTDSFVVRPLFFPGGDIGSLAINGTVNDLAMCGAQPKYLSAGFIIEEGFAVAELQRVAQSMAITARAAGVKLITGDTKVVERGKGDGLYINTAGVGVLRTCATIGPQQVQVGDAVLLSGDIGRHGIAVLSVREGLEFESAITSDCAPLADAVMQLIDAGIPIHCLRDPTRGGLATTLAEIAAVNRIRIGIQEQQVIVSDEVRGACEILGLDPLYVANEGRFVAFGPQHAAAQTLQLMHSAPGGENAAIIGHVIEGDHDVVLLTRSGAERPLDRLSGEQMPRIC